MTIRIQLRRNTTSEWSRLNPVLAVGEPGYAKDTGILKIGDGVTKWNDLGAYPQTDHINELIQQALAESGSGTGDGGATYQALLNHINSTMPHPVYDDGPSLLLLYQNAKV